MKKYKYQLIIDFESEEKIKKWSNDLIQYENGLIYFVDVLKQPNSINNTFIYNSGKSKLKRTK